MAQVKNNNDRVLPTETRNTRDGNRRVEVWTGPSGYIHETFLPFYTRTVEAFRIDRTGAGFSLVDDFSIQSLVTGVSTSGSGVRFNQDNISKRSGRNWSGNVIIVLDGSVIGYVNVRFNFHSLSASLTSPMSPQEPQFRYVATTSGYGLNFINITRMSVGERISVYLVY